MLTPAAAPRHLPSLKKLLRQCRSIQRLNQLHAHLLVHGSLSVASDLLASYCALSASVTAGYGAICHARRMFDGILDPDRVMYNTITRAYCNSDCPREALRLHRCMLRRGVLPNEFTLPFVVKACTRAQAWDNALAVHGVALKLGFVGQVFVANALLHSYASAGSLGDSRRFFDEMAGRNVVSWNSMIGGYAQAGDTREACALFGEMRRQGFLGDEFTLASLLLACSQEGNLEFGRLVHCHLLVSGSLGTNLVCNWI